MAVKLHEKWWPVIKDLRQDQELIAERWQAVRLQYNQLNGTCDQLVQSLWSLHALSFALTKVLSHRSPPSDWIKAKHESTNIQYINAAQVLPYNLQESYSRFLSNLRNHPEVIAEVLKWAGQEGLDTNHLTYDLVSVVYGHCLFGDDHTLLLESICHLLMDHISQCATVKEMFSIEPVCSRVITEYCQQLPTLKMFLCQSLRSPLQKIIRERSNDYLEYDVTKASTRLQERGEFNVEEYVDLSSHFLADICSHFLQELNKFQKYFPPSLKWLLGRLKKYMLQKWPHLSLSELRRPISYMFFGFIVSSAFVNPDLLGILDIRIILSDVTWYNFSQVIGVLQGCAWIIDKLESSDYPMKRVVKHMDMIPFNLLIDNIDNELCDGPPPVGSMLPGLTKNSYLFAQHQLDNIVGVVYDACNTFMDQANISPVQLEVNKAISVVPDAIIRKGRRNPYSFSLSNLSTFPQGGGATEPLKSPRPQKYNKQRSRSMWGVSTRNGKPLVSSADNKSLTLTSASRTLPKSSSSPPADSRGSSLSPSPSRSDLMGGGALPEEVLVLSIWNMRGERTTLPVETSWNIQLMTEEEFIRDRFSPGTAAIDPSNSLLLSSSSIKTRVKSDSTSSSSTCSLPSPQSRQPNVLHETSLNDKSLDVIIGECQSKSNNSADQSDLIDYNLQNLSSIKTEQLSQSTNNKDQLNHNDEPNQLVLNSNHDFNTDHSNQPESESNLHISNSYQSNQHNSGQLMTATGSQLNQSPNGDQSTNELLISNSLIADKEGELSKSWSPETYNGSESGQEEKEKQNEKLNGFSQSCDVFLDNDKVENNVLSSSAPQPKRSGIKAWFGKLKGKKRRSDLTLELDTPARPRVGSYTRRIGHITAKYEKLSREKRASEVPPPSKAPPSSPPTHSWPLPLPNTIEEFIPSNFYQQLKYKLTILLQQVHLPSIEMSGDEDLKEQLLLILSVVQLYVEWNNDYSESGVLMEVIDQLQSLDETCVHALLDGVTENHSVHLKYLDYLSSVQKQCYDAYLQVNSLQNTIERSRQLQVDSFLNFTMSSFCEERSAKLDQVKRDLERCSSADEKYALVQDLRDAFKTALEKDQNWKMWSDGDLEQVHRMCDDHIFSHLYQYIFHPNGDLDKERDEVFCRHIERISQLVTPQHHLLKIPQVYFSSCPWSQVQDIFLSMSIYKSPQAKLQCISKACKLLIRLLQLAKCGDPPGADDTFPVLVYILIKSNPVSLLSTEQYIKMFCEEDYLTGETAYWWTQFCSAIGFLRTPEFTQE